MSHLPPSTSSLKPGWYDAVSVIETVHKLPGGRVSFLVRWRLGDGAIIDDAQSFDIELDARGFLSFRGHFERLCKMLDAAALPGQPIIMPQDIVKLSGIKASVLVDVSGKVVEVKPRGGKT